MPGVSLAYAGSFGACAGCARLRRLPSWSWLATRQYQTMTGHCLDRVRTVCVCVPGLRMLACVQCTAIPELINYQGLQQTCTCRAWLQSRTQSVL